MKLTRRVLAVIVAVAMLVGVMAIGAFAAVGDYDATSNPFTTKIGLKAYRVDDSGEYVEITDGKVLDGEVIRIEVWGQTNYYANIANYIMAYSNGLFAPTKLDGSTYDYDATSATGLGMEVIEQIAYDEDALNAAYEAEGETGYASFDAPFAFNTAAKLTTAFAGADSASAIANMYPAAWKSDSAVNATGAAYNVLSAGYGPDIDVALPASANSGYNMAVVMVDYQPLVAFNLTVDAAAGTEGVVTLPEAAVRTSSNTSGRMYVSAGTPNANFDDFGFPAYEAQAVPSVALNFAQYKDTYEDGTVADRVVDLSEGTIDFTVVTSLDGGDEPIVPEVNKDALDAAIKTLPAFAEDEAEATSWANYAAALADANRVYADANATQDDVNEAAEALLAAIAAVVAKPAVAPELVALGDTIIDEELGFIYGLPHGDFAEIVDLVEDGYAEVTGDGYAVCTPADGQIVLGTGAKVVLYDSTDKAVATYYVVIFGDTDGDSFITSEDIIDASRWYAYLDSENDYEDFTNPASYAMDINGDDFVDDVDFSIVERYYAYLIEDVPQTR
ncbi:MAG: hypothetical protein IJN38_00570 [Clostridia bacterium]|nr:hypothetical protein [Clostridia bacterium]